MSDNLYLQQDNNNNLNSVSIQPKNTYESAWHDAGENITNVIIEDLGDGKYKTEFPDNQMNMITNYADVKLLHNNNYIIEVREDDNFEKIKTPENTEDLVKKLNNFVEDNTKYTNEAKIGGKKRNTSKIHKKSKKRIIKYKQNTKKSKK